MCGNFKGYSVWGFCVLGCVWGERYELGVLIMLMNGEFKDDGEYNYKLGGWMSFFIWGKWVFVLFFFYIKVVNDVKKNLWIFINFNGYFVVFFEFVVV